VRKKLELLQLQNIPVDYITFTPSGEPTLDDNLAQKIKLLREFGYKIAVITNASLLWNSKVQEDLLFADYVSLKIDTVNEETWLAVNRPHSRIKFQLILDGIELFTKKYHGVLATETMVVKDFNDTIQEIEAIGAFLKTIKRTKSYFTVPTRPPFELYAVAPAQQTLKKIAKYINANIPESETLFILPEDEFYGAGELENELVATLSAQPMQEEAIKKFIVSKGGNLCILPQLVENNKLIRVPYNGVIFFHAAAA
jgi:wyosine [tRNA(Phe)-imidazoG37] synthetase (radical SAM superfamily)